MHTDEKYVVFKREDYDELFSVSQRDQLSASVIEDAVVIRTQDSFAAGGLQAYADAIGAFVNITRKNIQQWGPRVGVMFESSLFEGGVDSGTQEAMQLRMLEEAEAYFRQCAQEAEDRLERGECKVPD